MPTQRLTETPDLPYRLGRHVNHDPASRRFAVARADIPIRSVNWARRVDIFDQGDLGSCTGNAAAGWLATDNADRRGLSEYTGPGGVVSVLDEADAVEIYSMATAIDPWPGNYPPDDTGSDGLSVTKVLQQLGYVDSYSHGFSLDDLLVALQTGPALIGIPWYQGMFTPDGNGVVTISGDVVGGHEILAVGVNVDRREIQFANSWGTGWAVRGYFFMGYDTVARLLSEDGDVTVPHALVVPEPVPDPTPVPEPEPEPVPEPVPTPSPVVDESTWWTRLWDAIFHWLGWDRG